MWFSRLWSCNIANTGCHHLSKMLRQTLSLKHLDLRLNQIGTTGAKFLCETLKNPKSKLKSLWWVVPFWTVICTSKELSSIVDPFRSQVSRVLYPIFSSICIYSWYIEKEAGPGRKLTLSSHHMRSRVQAQVGRLGSKGLYPLIHLTGMQSLFSFFKKRQLEKWLSDWEYWLLFQSTYMAAHNCL